MSKEQYTHKVRHSGPTISEISFFDSGGKGDPGDNMIVEFHESRTVPDVISIGQGGQTFEMYLYEWLAVREAVDDLLGRHGKKAVKGRASPWEEKSQPLTDVHHSAPHIWIGGNHDLTERDKLALKALSALKQLTSAVDGLIEEDEDGQDD